MPVPRPARRRPRICSISSVRVRSSSSSRASAIFTDAWASFRSNLVLLAVEPHQQIARRQPSTPRRSATRPPSRSLSPAPAPSIRPRRSRKSISRGPSPPSFETAVTATTSVGLAPSNAAADNCWPNPAGAETTNPKQADHDDRDRSQARRNPTAKIPRHRRTCCGVGAKCDLLRTSANPTAAKCLQPARHRRCRPRGCGCVRCCGTRDDRDATRLDLRKRCSDRSMANRDAPTRESAPVAAARLSGPADRWYCGSRSVRTVIACIGSATMAARLIGKSHHLFAEPSSQLLGPQRRKLRCSPLSDCKSTPPFQINGRAIRFFGRR